MIIIMLTAVDTRMSMLRKTGLHARGRIALRDLANQGLIPGMVKSSW